MNYQEQAYKVLYDLAQENKKEHDTPFPFVSAKTVVEAWEEKILARELKFPEGIAGQGVLQHMLTNGWIRRTTMPVKEERETGELENTLIHIILPLRNPIKTKEI